MRTRDRRTARLLATGLFAAAGLGLAGCGPEDEVADEEISDDVAEEVADAGVAGGNAGSFAFDGDYNQAFYEEAATYADEEVTLAAEVGETLSPDSFTITGADSPLLVIEQNELPTLDAGQSVQVSGALEESFDVATVEQELGVDLPDEAVADFTGEPYIMAAAAEVAG